MTKTKTCPICKRPRTQEFTPFCSQRCKDRDLAQWFGDGRERLSETTVRFKSLSDEEIAAYLTDGEWHGKAGGYAIQGAAEGLIQWIKGSHSGVMGLPLYETRALLKAAGFAVG